MISRRIVAAIAVLGTLVASAHAQTGSPKTAAQLNTEINSSFADNAAFAITPFKLRQVTLDQVASFATYGGLNPFTNTTDITIPSPSVFPVTGGITSLGGMTVVKGFYAQGGYIYLGTGANGGGVPTTLHPAGGGTAILSILGGDASAVGGCGGAVIDFDNGLSQLQTLTIGNLGAVTNCLISGIPSYDSTPTWKSNQGRWIFYSGAPTLGGSTTSMIGTLDYAQGMRVNLNTTLTFAALTPPLTGTSLQLTQTDATMNRLQMDAYGAANFITGSRSNCTKGSPCALVVDNEIMGINAYGYGTSTQGPAGHLGIYAAATWSGTSTPSYVDFCTTAVSSTACGYHLRFDNFGSLLVGTTTPAPTSNIGIAVPLPTSGTGGGSFIAGNIGVGGALSWYVGNASGLGGLYDTTMEFFNAASAYRFGGLTAGIMKADSSGTISIQAGGVTCASITAGTVTVASGVVTHC